MAKRAAARQLTQDNWDEPDEEPEASETAEASPREIATRVIRTARRRHAASSQEKKGIFTGFSGFNKAPVPTSNAFSFISNLVNGKTNEAQKNEPFSFVNKLSDDKAEVKSNSLSEEKNSVEKESTERTDTDKNKINDMNDKSSKEKSEYYVNLKCLNLSVSEWIKSHVDKNPYCILTPIFDDYVNHLKDLEKLQTESSEVKSTDKGISQSDSSKSGSGIKTMSLTKDTLPAIKEKPMSSSIFPTFPVTPKINNESKTNLSLNSPSMFSLGFQSTPVSKPSTISFGQKMSTEPASSAFSFGSEKPFSFSNVTPKEVSAAPSTENDENEDEPPKVTFTPVVEEDYVYSKRCKIFVKKNDNFGDRGVGTLYIKPIKDSQKFQAIMRADTSIGNLLLNIVLTQSIPTQRMGKNNVMLICIPTSDEKPPPVPTLLRVKSADEADELLNTLNKYKK